MKKVFIGTVSSTGNLCAYYVSSLVKSQELLIRSGIDCYIDIIIDEPLLHIARNRMLKLFIDSDCDELIMIDSDQAWDPYDLLKLINSDKDFIGAPVILKSENRYNVSFQSVDENDIIEVDYVGTGFLKISRNVAESIYNISSKYDNGENKDAMAFETEIFDGNIISEDFVFCRKWNGLGGKVYIDTTIDPYHIGTAIYKGSFKKYLFDKIGNKNG